jgi:hypothetical protein
MAAEYSALSYMLRALGHSAQGCAGTVVLAPIDYASQASVTPLAGPRDESRRAPRLGQDR